MNEQLYDINTFKVLLADTIREKTNSYMIREIFTRYPTIEELLEITYEELITINGIGPVKARQIIASINLAKMLPLPSNYLHSIHCPKDVYEYVKDMQYLTKEHFVIIGLNTKNQIMFKETVSIGTLNTTIVHPREVFKLLIKRTCSAGIAVHCHPSGDPAPSSEDLEVTKRLVEAGKILGIDIIDHIIIGHNRYISFKDKGLI